MGKRFNVQTPVLDEDGEIVALGDFEQCDKHTLIGANEDDAEFVEWVNTCAVGECMHDFALIERVA